MRNQVFILCSALFLFAGHHDAYAQGFLKKLGKRLEQKIENTVEGKARRTVKGRSMALPIRPCAQSLGAK